MVSDYLKARIMVLRGLGFQQKEIADKLNLSQTQVAYNLSELKEDSVRDGEAATFLKVLTAGYGPQLAQLAQKIGEIK
ncbi:MAG: hypothetical protein ABH851_07825 [Methanobacteriota archaeon]